MGQVACQSGGQLQVLMHVAEPLLPHLLQEFGGFPKQVDKVC